jgi:integrase
MHANITTGDVTVHTLRRTALSRIVEHGLDDFTVMLISGHSSRGCSSAQGK